MLPFFIHVMATSVLRVLAAAGLHPLESRTSCLRGALLQNWSGPCQFSLHFLTNTHGLGSWVRHPFFRSVTSLE
jgi:hypothetical protein